MPCVSPCTGMPSCLFTTGNGQSFVERVQLCLGDPVIPICQQWGKKAHEMHNYMQGWGLRQMSTHDQSAHTHTPAGIVSSADNLPQSRLCFRWQVAHGTIRFAAAPVSQHLGQQGSHSCSRIHA